MKAYDWRCSSTHLYYRHWMEVNGQRHALGQTVEAWKPLISKILLKSGSTGYKGNSKTKINLSYIQRSSPYRAVNTLRLSYTNQSVNAV